MRPASPSVHERAGSAPVPTTGTRTSRFGVAVCCTWLLVVLGICVRVALFPHRQSSFAADYAPAGWHWLHAQEIYGFRHNFVYSPLLAAAFAPLAALPERVSGVLWRLASVAAFGGTALAWLRSGLTLESAPSPRSLDHPAMATAGLLLLPLTIGNINLGQINLLVLACIAGGVLAVRARRWNLAALLLAFTGFIKIYPLAVGILLAGLYPRQLLWRLMFYTAALFVASLVLQQPAYVWREYHRWFAVLGRDDRLDIDLYASWRDFGFLLRAGGIPLADRAYRMMEAGAGGALALYLWLAKWRRAWTEPQLLGAVFSLGCGWMLLFGPATEDATYVILGLPICAVLAAAWQRSPRPQAGGVARSTGLRAIFSLSYLLLLGAQIANSWFHGNTHHLYMRALQPIAALLFTVGACRWLEQSQPARPARQSNPQALGA